jgi:hypothetical protein
MNQKLFGGRTVWGFFAMTPGIRSQLGIKVFGRTGRSSIRRVPFSVYESRGMLYTPTPRLASVPAGTSLNGPGAL